MNNKSVGEQFLEALFIVFIVAVVVSVFIGAIKLIAYAAAKQETGQKEEYATCKQKTNDLEWCFKTVYGQDVSN